MLLVVPTWSSQVPGPLAGWGGHRQSVGSALGYCGLHYMVHAAFWSTTRYPSRSSNVCPCTSQYGLYDGTVEDQQMILCGSCVDLVSRLGRELQMVGLVGMSEDDAIEAIM